MKNNEIWELEICQFEFSDYVSKDTIDCNDTVKVICKAKKRETAENKINKWLAYIDKQNKCKEYEEGTTFLGLRLNGYTECEDDTIDVFHCDEYYGDVIENVITAAELES